MATTDVEFSRPYVYTIGVERERLYTTYNLIGSFRVSIVYGPYMPSVLIACSPDMAKLARLLCQSLAAYANWVRTPLCNATRS